ncbi:bifunctional riboflavin kinase/FAD synthetase [Bdellovibrionota bacterium FG-2]
MKVIKGIEFIAHAPRKPVLTIGNFDGVHLGHAQIISTVLKKAQERGGSSLALTFHPHPQIALKPQVELPLLSSYDEKLELLVASGLDLIIEEPFSREFSTVAPEQFFTDRIIRGINPEAIVVGYDFAFGNRREGHLDLLKSLCDKNGIELTIVPPFRLEGEVVSSSRIRQYLLAGDIQGATRLLGRPFSYRGVVVKGEGRGRKLGYPTANLKLENKLVLPYGVYATQARFGERVFPSVTNVGVRPTFFEREKEGEALPALVETYLINTTIDLYGSTLEVLFQRRLREERKFSGVAALKAQIAQDVRDVQDVQDV